MIERNLQYVTLRKHGTAFLDAFGFFPIDYFGCVGDNQTDNYANLQVAINESIKKGYSYLFVPNGDYLYHGNLVDADKIMFVGNVEYAHVYNPDDDTLIPIYQIGTQLPYFVGTETISETTSKLAGYFDIPIPIKRAAEAILVIGSDVLYVTPDLVLLNGSMIVHNETIIDDYYIDTDVRVSNVELLDGIIRIVYLTDNQPATIDKTIEWRVR